uniref:Uncharacterized protein n=1 Tax=Marseillevirus LCMAC101 TaxID=2506602 RepID=A0A481YS74_9VIRU|nr:MAG: hypothetical protein LCMAC101_03920 [Marseillevirus LCMAC101]
MEIEIKGSRDLSPKSNIPEDLLRFSKLHLWYKHLPFEGKEFLVFPWTGQQPKNFFEPEVTDQGGLHWWVWYADFIDEIPLDGRGKEIVMQHSVTFNCFLRGLEECGTEKGSTFFRGWYLIKRSYPTMEKVLRKRYPNAKGNSDLCAAIEHNLQLENAKIAAENIYDLMYKECPRWLKTNNTSKKSLMLNECPACRRLIFPSISGGYDPLDSYDLPSMNSFQPEDFLAARRRKKERPLSDDPKNKASSSPTKKGWDFSLFHRSSSPPRNGSPGFTKKSNDSPKKSSFTFKRSSSPKDDSPSFRKKSNSPKDDSPIPRKKNPNDSPTKGPVCQRKKSSSLPRKDSPMITTRSCISPRDYSPTFAAGSNLSPRQDFPMLPREESSLKYENAFKPSPPIPKFKKKRG